MLFTQAELKRLLDHLVENHWQAFSAVHYVPTFRSVPLRARSLSPSLESVEMISATLLKTKHLSPPPPRLAAKTAAHRVCAKQSS